MVDTRDTRDIRIRWWLSLVVDVGVTLPDIRVTIHTQRRKPSRHKTLNQCWFNVGLRRWTNVKPTLIQRLVSAARRRRNNLDLVGRMSNKL